MEKLSNAIEMQQFDKTWLVDDFFPLVREMKETAKKNSGILSGKRMIALFDEPSLKTRVFIEAAMKRLGGEVVTFSENAGEFSSEIGGGTIEDTVLALSCLTDIFVIRSKEKEIPKRAAAVSPVPIINAGDGVDGQQPLQSLTDGFTIFESFGRINGLTSVLCGELARSRTARSLAYLLGKSPDNKINFISPETAKMQKDILNHLKECGICPTEGADLREIVSGADIIYLIQLFRSASTEFVLKHGNSFCKLDREVLKLVKKDAIIMHPLPHGPEIAADVFSDPRVVIFRQAANTLYVDMALLIKILTG